ncbi:MULTISPECIES: AzlC family ABC transporter permease [Ruminococcus]|uniref:4-azaleucine resistance transporter AzlC n=1 Tax=Ruminococcus flavefaciens TaxID=1265 RepID=A0A315XUZ5_RUMFL|nr:MULTISPECIES: AzlC family ABC transporter permease [Ruminococcus]MBQ6250340.1 AzlC family ABC transporter permease [Ruminococcus sp.]MBR3667434.1 AzlC family ABC transporter permease [Ruminococcus sp.]MBR6995488.1 AzlC family ABC transporter permease [Ruminococcus sp.]PWJ10600.1 4-azaleucine resistance transporter AzlC [Ruminococcus flavefaciens]SSA51687.1 4-azaleucine resistance probable transporter AzlC [Ruminococcus flavefaciens]
MKNNFLRGMSHGIPICLGYLSVSFGFGILAVSKAGLSVFQASIISASNLTSAGQKAGIDVIAAGGTIIEMILLQLTINIRYSLMALSLSQKLDKRFTTPHRLMASYGITDEIFAVCSAQKTPLTPAYMYGMILIAAVGWVTGTALGAAAGELLPLSVSKAMEIVLYGMFIAIIIPPAKKQHSVLFVIAMAAALSVVFRYCLPMVSDGFAIIISAVAASAAAAFIFPVKDEEAEE